MNRRQKGVVILILLAMVVIGGIYIFLSSQAAQSISQNRNVEREKITSTALSQAKDALIGYAASVALGQPGPRPGDLPCPDVNNDGIAGTSCGNASGSTGQSLRLGRLPWKTLGLPDLRDGSGERLWYAVSNNFKNNTRNSLLNSDTLGTIAVRSSDGSMLNNGVVAVVIAPGQILQRSDKGAIQDRSSAGINAPENYLEIAAIGGITEDNANFADGTTNGFIQGEIRDGNGRVILNDQLLIITQEEIMPALQKRVAAEVKQCLSNYGVSNQGRYPWAAIVDPSMNYSDRSGQLFGHVPDTPFVNTCSDSGGTHCGNEAYGAMGTSWTGSCTINSMSGWWLNWKEMVFYGLADAFKPVNPMISPACGYCLVVNPPSTLSDKKFVVIVAGRSLAGQVRIGSIDKGNLANYLEAPNSAGLATFSQQKSSAAFNDTVLFQ